MKTATIIKLIVPFAVAALTGQVGAHQLGHVAQPVADVALGRAVQRDSRGQQVRRGGLEDDVAAVVADVGVRGGAVRLGAGVAHADALRRARLKNGKPEPSRPTAKLW